MKVHFFLNLLNGFIATLATFVLIEMIPLPNLPFNIEKIFIFGTITLILGLFLLRNKPLTSLIATVLGGVFAGFLMYNYSPFITDFITNTLFGSALVGILGTVFKYVIDVIMKFI